MSSFTYSILNCRNYTDLYDYINKYITDVDLSITNENEDINLNFSFYLDSDQIQLLDNILLSYIPDNTIVTLTLNKSICINNTQIKNANIWSTIATYYFIPILDSTLYNIILTAYTNGADYKIRLYDITNNIILVSSNTLYNKSSQPIILNTSFIDFPSTNSILEIQVFQNSNCTIFINSCNFIYANIIDL